MDIEKFIQNYVKAMEQFEINVEEIAEYELILAQSMTRLTKLENMNQNVEVVNKIKQEFRLIVSIKKLIKEMERKRDKILVKIEQYFNDFPSYQHDFYKRVIHLNQLISRLKQKVDNQIVRCVDYFSENDINILV